MSRSGITAPRTPSAGSTEIARRRPARLATRPTTTAMTGSNRYECNVSETGNGIVGPSNAAMPQPMIAAATDKTTAWSPKPPRMDGEETPVALKTAKSRCRSSTET